MICEVFFTINGNEEQQNSVALKIAQFLQAKSDKGDICELSGTFEEKKLEEILS